MCGLFGSYSISQQSRLEKNLSQLQAAQSALHHRGPDDRGLETFSINRGTNTQSGLLSLGHTRLSIIDLSSAGHQPMHSFDKRYTIVFNGEIYNYKELRADLKSSGYMFNTESDTEVLLAAWAFWGPHGLHRLIGMFAFVVYDRQDETLTLVRDAFGIKPLFYSMNEGNFYFASEMSALLTLLPSKSKQDLQQTYDYLVYGRYDDQDRTFVKGVKHILPGHWMQIDLKTLSTPTPVRWWWPSVDENVNLSFNDAADKLRYLILKNVRLHLRSDVPVGTTLSGGIDSSAIVCAIRYLEPEIPIHTFSYIAQGSVFNEEKWIDIVNQKVKAIDHKVIINQNELEKDFEQIITAQGEPFGDLSIYAQFKVFEEVKKFNIKVILDGQGADEIFAGYEGYPESVIKDIFEKKGFMASISFLNSWMKWPGRSKIKCIGFLLKSLFPGSFQNGRLSKFKNNSYKFIDESVFGKFGIKKYSNTGQKVKSKSRHLACSLREDLTSTRLRRLLRYADRNAMNFSIENRVPFLTLELAEFMLTLPMNYLVSSNGETKKIFRKAMQDIVPKEILRRRDKLGFNTPNTWADILKKIVKSNYQNREDILLRKHIFSDSENFNNWKLVNYLGWKEIYKKNFN